MNVKEFEAKVKLADEQDILVTALVCVQELLRRKVAENRVKKDG